MPKEHDAKAKQKLSVTNALSNNNAYKTAFSGATTVSEVGQHHQNDDA